MGFQGEQAAWERSAVAMRRLAASLIRDPSSADDLVSEAFLRARRGDSERGLGWWRRVMVNLAIDRRRAEARRDVSERLAARGESLPSAGEVVSGWESARILASEVARLKEPYRTAIHLRYFEGLSPESIAERGGWPVESVRTRLRRGLELLRERLDSRHSGGREQWMAAWAPLASIPSSTSVSSGIGSAWLGGLTIMGMKSTLALLTAGIAVLSWFLLHSTPPSEPSAVDVGLSSPAAVEPAPNEPVARNGDRRVAEAPIAQPASVSPTEPAASARARTRITGSVVVTDPQGREHRATSGTFHLMRGLTHADFETEVVPFKQGQWSAEAIPGGFVVFAELVADGKRARTPEPLPQPVGNEPYVVRGDWLARGSLRVIDALSGQELTGIEVRAAQGWRANPSWIHPGDHAAIQRLVADAASPVELPARTFLTPYWVHAPGHAWARVDFDHRVGGERTVELDPAPAAIEVRAVGGRVPGGAFARLHFAERAPVSAEIPSWMAAASCTTTPEGVARFEDLAPGDYVASIEVGEYEDLLRLGSQPVRVGGGERARVDVVFDAKLLDVPRSRIFGEIHLPRGADLADKSLLLEREEGGEGEYRVDLTALSYSAGRPRVLHFDAGPRRVGRWIATIEGFEHRVRFETAARGDTRVVIRMPELIPVTVEAVDADDGRTLQPQRWMWGDAPIEDLRSTRLLPILLDPTTREPRIVAPAGPIVVHAELDGYAYFSETFELRAGMDKLRVEMVKARSIRLSFREGDAAFAPPETWLAGVRVEALDDPANATTSVRYGGAQLHIDVARPGRYRVELPPLNGFVAFEPRVVRVDGYGVVDEIVRFVR